MASYSISALARKTGTTSRNIRAYQNRGLVAPPRREGRNAYYGDEHVGAVRLIRELLERGYTLASIKELLEARSKGKGLEGVLGVVNEATRSWSDEEPVVVSLEYLERMFGPNQFGALQLAMELGLLELDPEGVRIVSPRLLQVGAQLHASGVPLPDVFDELRILRTTMEAIAGQFVDLTAKHIWSKFSLDSGGRVLPEVNKLIRRLRPLAQEAVDAELARAMRLQSVRYLETIVSKGVGRPDEHVERPVEKSPGHSEIPERRRNGPLKR